MQECRWNIVVRRSMLFFTALITGGAFLYNIYALTAIFIIFCIAYTWRNHIRWFQQKHAGIYCFFAFIILLNLYHMYDNGHWSDSVITRYMNFIIAYLMVICYPPDPEERMRTFSGDYAFLGKVFVLHALVSMVAAALFPNAFSIMEEHPTVLHFYHILYSVSVTDVNTFLHAVPRCMGMFWEPGVLQFFINVFLFILLFYQEKRNWKWIFLATAVILLTQSITGIFLCAIQYVYFFIIRKHYFMLVLSCIAMFSVGAHMIGIKIHGETSSEAGSYWSRQADALAAWNIIEKKPVLGIGFDVDDFLRYRNMVDDQGVLTMSYTWDRTNTNSVLLLFYGLGIPIGLLVMWWLFRQSLLPKHRLIVFIICCISSASEPILFLVFLVCFTISGMLPRLDENLPAELESSDDNNPEVE